jgi:SAM-dependent methyltransferase
MARLVFTESLALLGATDLHPGGRDATNFLLDELQKGNPSRVLEIGAGSGATTERMIRRGWQVTPIEPSKVLRNVLEKRLGVSVYPEEFQRFEGAEASFDAAIGESVFYCLDHATAFGKLHRLLRPGGLLAFVDQVWTEAGDPTLAASIHDRTARAFGIPAASREWLTWPRWRERLTEAGFAPVVETRLPSDSFQPISRWAKLAGGLRHPLALAHYLNYRRFYRMTWAPPGCFESWMAVWRRV